MFFLSSIVVKARLPLIVVKARLPLIHCGGRYSSVRTALSDQGNHLPYIMHGIYYLKEGEQVSSVYQPDNDQLRMRSSVHTHGMAPQMHACTADHFQVW